MYKNLKYLFISSLAFVACSEDIKDEFGVEESLTAGSADFTKYVALGNSLTAGFSDGALFIEGQANSYPNIMATEFAKVGSGAFNQPLMKDNRGGFQSGGVQVPGFATRLFFNGAGPQNVPGLSATVISESIASQGPFQNLGVPGAKVFHLGINGYGALNPYYGRMATSPTASVIQDAVAQNPTFFSLWIGNNDVLSFALSGGTGVDQAGNTNPATYGTNDITDPNVFAASFTQLVNALTANGAKGIVANIPNVSTLPFFTTVPFNAANLNSAQVTALNSGYSTYNGGLALALSLNAITTDEYNRRLINFSVGQNALVIEDEYLSSVPGLPKYRHATNQDFILLSSNGSSTQAHLLAGNGTAAPLTDQWVLTLDEVAIISTATSAFNNAIKLAADSKGLAFVDAFAILNQISTTGYQHGGFNFTNAYVFGNTFSLDGFHLGPRAYGMVANKMLEAINSTYGSNFKPINLSRKPALYGLSLPNP